MILAHVRTGWWGTRDDRRTLADQLASPPPPPPDEPPQLARARLLLAERNLVLHDVPHDGSCIVWALLPAIVEHVLCRPTTEREVRALLVDAMSRPELADDMAQDLRQSNAYQFQAGARQFADVASLLAHYRQPYVYLQPIVAAKAFELLSGTRIEMLSIADNQLFTLYASPEESQPTFTTRLFYEPALEHNSLLTP